MAGLLVVFFPFVLLAFMILMERVESPLRTVAVEDRVEEFLEEARPEEMDTFVREGFPAALNQLEPAPAAVPAARPPAPPQGPARGLTAGASTQPDS